MIFVHPARLYSTHAVSFEGATPAQARAALRQCKDVMEAAELFFEGKFDDVKDGDDVQMASSSDTKRRDRPTVRLARSTMRGLCTGLMKCRPQKMMVKWAPMMKKRSMRTKTRMVCKYKSST